MDRITIWISCLALAGLSMMSATATETVTYIHTDALGSVVAESDEQGKVTKRYDYEPYGQVVGGVVADGPGYTGHVSDATTGLSYMQQRYYDPKLGAFLSVDPVTAHSNQRHFNRYNYAYNNPYAFKDPDGRIPVLPIIAGGIMGGLADIGVQKAINPDKPVDKVEVGVAVALGTISGGSGGLLAGAVGSGSVSVGKAIGIQAVVNLVAGGAGAAAESAIKGEPITAEGIATNALGNAAGGLAGSGVGAAMGDFAGPAAKGTLQRLSQSSAPGAANIASTTASTGVAIPRQSITQGAFSQAGQNAAGAAAGLAQKEVEKKK
jgi:RHS repeat-associated protein